MRRHPFHGATLIALAFSLVACAPSPTKVVDDFYAASTSMKLSGLPAGKELDRVKPFLSRGLLQLIASADSFQADYIKKNPGDKPPFVEGDLFSSLFEGPTSYTVDSVTALGDGYRVSVAFEYRDPLGKAAPVQWRDAVDVTKENGRFVIDDIEMLGPWAFKMGARLRDVLSAR